MSSLCPSPISQPGFSIWRTVPVMWLLLGAWHVTAVAAPEPMHLGPRRCSFELQKLPKCSKAWLDSGWASGEGSCCCCLADRHEASGYPLHCCCRHRPSWNASTCTPVLLQVFLFRYQVLKGLVFFSTTRGLYITDGYSRGKRQVLQEELFCDLLAVLATYDSPCLD